MDVDEVRMMDFFQNVNLGGGILKHLWPLNNFIPDTFYGIELSLVFTSILSSQEDISVRTLSNNRNGLEIIIGYFLTALVNAIGRNCRFLVNIFHIGCLLDTITK